MDIRSSAVAGLPGIGKARAAALQRPRVQDPFETKHNLGARCARRGCVGAVVAATHVLRQDAC